MSRILIIDDELEHLRDGLDEALEEHERLYAFSAREGVERVQNESGIDLVLLDNRMDPPTLTNDKYKEGIEALRQIRKSHPYLPVIMLSAMTEPDFINDAFDLGAYHYLVKPLDIKLMKVMIQAAMERGASLRQLSSLRAAIRMRDEELAAPETSRTSFGDIVGQSAAMRQVFKRIERAAPTDVSVLVRGERGTGKEGVARAIHAFSDRKKATLEVVDCPSVPQTLFESHFFGHVKGAFSGAEREHSGCVARADKGTLFLDEIGELPLELQAKLLRVLEYGVFTPVGGETEVKVDIRLICATNRDLYAMCEEGTFKVDLFDRLNIISVRLPALRERKEDIPLLVDHFMESSPHNQGHRLTDDALRALMAHSWPGNVRKLKSVIESTLILAESKEIDAQDLQNMTDTRDAQKDLIERLWQKIQEGVTPASHAEFADRFGRTMTWKMLERAGQELGNGGGLGGTSRERGRLLRFLPEDDPEDKAFNTYRKWEGDFVKSLTDEDKEAFD